MRFRRDCPGGRLPDGFALGSFGAYRLESEICLCFDACDLVLVGSPGPAGFGSRPGGLLPGQFGARKMLRRGALLARSFVVYARIWWSNGDVGRVMGLGMCPDRWAKRAGSCQKVPKSGS